MKILNYLSALFVAMLIIGCSKDPIMPETDNPEIAQRNIIEYFNKQQEVVNVSWNIVTSKKLRCNEKNIYDYGFMVSDESYLPDSYKNTDTKLSEFSRVTTLVEKGPAGKAGMKRWDQIISINGMKINKRKPSKHIKRVIGGIENELPTIKKMKILRDGQLIELENIVGVSRCGLWPMIRIGKKIETKRDENRLIITTKAMDVITRLELEFIIAHGLIHYNKGHVMKKNIVKGGTFIIDNLIGLEGKLLSEIINYGEDYDSNIEIKTDLEALEIMEENGTNISEIENSWVKFKKHPNLMWCSRHIMDELTGKRLETFGTANISIYEEVDISNN